MNRALFSIFAVLCLVHAQAIKIDLLHGEVKPRMLAHSASEEEKGDGLSRGLRNLENNQYYSYVGFGKDSQGNINWRPVVYDTGSSWLWTSKDDCKCTNVGGKTLNPDDISSWKSSGKEIKLEYGSGNLIGDLGTLHTYFSETEYVTNQYALLATQATMVGGPTSGIFGLSQKAGSDNYPTMIYNLKDQGKISKLMFTVALRPNTAKPNEGSYIKLGEASTDEVLEGQDFYYVPLVNSGLYDNYYSFEVGRIAIGDDVYVNKNVGVADTGTSLLALPVPFLESLLEKYGGSKSCARTNVGLYGCKCTGASQIDDMTVQVGTHEWTIPSEKFVIAEDGYCIFLIQPSPIEELMILGDIFLRNVVAVFDIENEQIGFASNVSQVAPTLKPVVTSSGMSGVQSSVLEEVNHKGENRNEDEIDPQLFLPM